MIKMEEYQNTFKGFPVLDDGSVYITRIKPGFFNMGEIIGIAKESARKDPAYCIEKEVEMGFERQKS